MIPAGINPLLLGGVSTPSIEGYAFDSFDGVNGSPIIGRAEENGRLWQGIGLGSIITTSTSTIQNNKLNQPSVNNSCFLAGVGLYSEVTCDVVYTVANTDRCGLMVAGTDDGQYCTAVRISNNYAYIYTYSAWLAVSSNNIMAVTPIVIGTTYNFKMTVSPIDNIVRFYIKTAADTVYVYKGARNLPAELYRGGAVGIYGQNARHTYDNFRCVPFVE